MKRERQVPSYKNSLHKKLVHMSSVNYGGVRKKRKKKKYRSKGNQKIQGHETL